MSCKNKKATGIRNMSFNMRNRKEATRLCKTKSDIIIPKAIFSEVCKTYNFKHDKSAI